MLEPRIIPCLLIHKGGLVKTVRFKSPKYVGDPLNAVRIFNEKKVDEIMVLDIDASVTTPKPDNEESPFPADAAIPIPKDKTNGTVTGPVVTAPQSHARPKIVLRSGLFQTKIVRRIAGVSAI